MYAVDPKNEFIMAADLRDLISEVKNDDRLVRFGFDITVSFNSHTSS